MKRSKMVASRNQRYTVLIHGAINTSNFGDVLFINIFYQTIKDNNQLNPIFIGEGKYSISDFNRKELDYYDKVTKKQAEQADILVYMSGGYFGDDKKSIIKSIQRYNRYFKIGLKFVKAKKPIIIIGVGGGPLFYPFCLKAAKKIMNNSKLITVRDAYTKNYFETNGVKKDIILTADTALTLKKNCIPKLDKNTLAEIKQKIGNRKILFFHVTETGNGNIEMLEKIIPAINKFIKENKNYGVIISRDGYKNDDLSKSNLYKKINTKYKYSYNYCSSMQFCSLLNNVDLIITPKLHVGIIGSHLGKSVISVPVHSSKTKRFYQQIGQDGRCVQMDEADSTIVYSLLNKYKNKPIVIPNDMINLANENIRSLSKLTDYLR